MPENQLTITVDATHDGADALFGAYVGLVKRLFPDDDTKWRALRNAAEIVRRKDDHEFQVAIQSAVYRGMKG